MHTRRRWLALPLLLLPLWPALAATRDPSPAGPAVSEPRAKP